MTISPGEYGNEDGTEPVDVGRCGISNTPGGVFTYHREVQGHRQSALGGMLNPVYFNYGIAVHGSSNVPSHPASHGCVRIPNALSARYQSLVAVGERVFVWDGIEEPEVYGEQPPTFDWEWEEYAAATTTTPSLPTTLTSVPTTTPSTSTAESSTTTTPHAHPTTTAIVVDAHHHATLAPDADHDRDDDVTPDEHDHSHRDDERRPARRARWTRFVTWEPCVDERRQQRPDGCDRRLACAAEFACCGLVTRMCASCDEAGPHVFTRPHTGNRFDDAYRSVRPEPVATSPQRRLLSHSSRSGPGAARRALTAPHRRRRPCRRRPRRSSRRRHRARAPHRRRQPRIGSTRSTSTWTEARSAPAVTICSCSPRTATSSSTVGH